MVQVDQSSGPTRLTVDPARAWSSRPAMAKAIKVLAVVVPIAGSIAFAFVLVRLLPTPETTNQILAWWVLVATLVVAFAQFSDRLARKALPLAGLLELSLVFPDAAPSRFGVAIRTNSVRQLQREISTGTFDPDETPEGSATQLLSMVTALNNHDRATRGHTERVRAYSLLIGEEMGLNPTDLNKLHWAAMLHDIGKLGVRPEVLNKASRLDDDEWAELARHPGHGAEMSEPLRPWLGKWIDAAGQHHEKWDGSGYPLGLSGSEISPGARIVAVADAFDVMTSVRSYKEAMPAAEARAELTRCAGTQFDPVTVRAMISVSLGVQKGTGRVAALLAQFPILANGWSNIAAVSTSTTTAVVVAVAATTAVTPPPELAAFVDLEVIEDSSAETAVQSDLSNAPSSVAILSVDGPVTATWTGSTIEVTGLPNQNGSALVTYQACWPTGECIRGEVPATITPVNDDPEPADDDVLAELQGPILVKPLTNDSDPDGDQLEITGAEVVSGPGLVDIVDASTIRITPEAADPSLPHEIVLDYTVSDSAGATGTARVTAALPMFNTGPVAEADQVTVAAGGSIEIQVLDNDQDPDRDVLSVTAVSLDPEEPQLGTATFDASTVTFTAAPGASGTATFTYEISDGYNADSATVTVSIVPPPITTEDALTMRVNESGWVSPLANDIANGSDLDPDSLGVSSPQFGQTVVQNGRIRFTPDSGFSGIVGVTYEICNVLGGCSSGVIYFTVLP